MSTDSPFFNPEDII